MIALKLIGSWRIRSCDQAFDILPSIIVNYKNAQIYDCNLQAQAT